MDISIDADISYSVFHSEYQKDPIHTAHSEATNKKAALEMPDFSKIGDDIVGALKSKKADLDVPDFSKIGDEVVGALKKSPLGKLFSKN